LGSDLSFRTLRRTGPHKNGLLAYGITSSDKFCLQGFRSRFQGFGMASCAHTHKRTHTYTKQRSDQVFPKAIMAPSRARGEVHPQRAAHDYPEAVGAHAPLHTATTARVCTRQRGAGAEGSDLARFITARRVKGMDAHGRIRCVLGHTSICSAAHR